MLTATLHFRRYRGFVLVLAVVLLVVVASLSVHYLAAVRTEYRIAENLAVQRQVMDMAEAGLMAAQELLRQDTNQTDSLGELWAKVEVVPLGDEADDVAVTLSIIDEERKLNVNSLLSRDRRDIARPVFERLLGAYQPPLPLAVLDELRDWMDSDALREPLGAEISEYHAAKLRYSAKNRPVEHLSELLLLPSLDAGWYYGSRDQVNLQSVMTALPNSDLFVNINTAPPPVLLALNPNLSTALVEQLLAARSDKPLSSLADLRQRVPAMSLALDDARDRLPDKLRFRSSYFRVLVNADKDGVWVSLEALLHRSSGLPEVLYRRLGNERLPSLAPQGSAARRSATPGGAYVAAR